MGSYASQEVSKMFGQKMTIFQWLGYANSMVNPIIYTIFQRDLKRAITDTAKRIFKC